MQAVQNFAFDETLVRVVVRDEAPWFVADDVGRALGIEKIRNTISRFSDDEKGAHTVGTPGGQQNVLVLSEPGLYRVIFLSRKPEAERFQRWVFHEVLPAIRRTGRFEHAAPALTPRAEPIPENQIYRLNLVREARLLFGADRARGLWGQLGLPPVPEAPDTEQDEARACLRHLLDATMTGLGGARVGDALLEVLGGEDQKERSLMLFAGVRADPERDVFVIATIDDGLRRVFQATPWKDGRWTRVLRRLPGASRTGSIRFNGIVRKGTELPSDYLDANYRMRPPLPLLAG